MERIGVVPGTEIGGYRVLGPLGRGGMGSVYRAVDADGVAVAMKVLHAHLAADDAHRERLRREVANLQRVRHPAVARVLDAEIDADDAFVVTELVEGTDLAARVRDGGPLPPAAVGDLAERLREALEVVHDAGVLHRDLSPGNVMLSPRGPVLIDFGIAQTVEDARVTATGMVVGTPGYLSPEMVRGGEPSSAADWWGWAAVLAFAATGRAPFGTRPLAAVLARVESGEADLAGLDPRTAAALRSALVVDPAARAEPSAVVAELRRAAGGDTAVAGDTQVLPGGRATQAVPTATAVLPPWGPGPAPSDADRTAVLGVTDATAVVPAAAGDDDWDTADGGDGWDRADGSYDDDRAADGADSADGADNADGDAFEPFDPDAQDEPVSEEPPPVRRRAISVLAVGVVLVALAATRPVTALLVAVAAAALCRTVGVGVHALYRRRARRGGRRGDAARSTVASPWYLLLGVLGVVPAAVVAASTVVVVGGVTWWLLGSGRLVVAAPAAGEPAGELAGNAAWVTPALLAAAAALGLVVLWFGPLMRTTRTGARWVLRAVAPGAVGATVLVLVALAAAALVVTTWSGTETIWWPLPGPPELR
ncbi:serine/threonine-protein kinase [Actinotalea sp. Marseille-Q4924]|uniref:serine/threonine-protein kinase n=1 Tax=Actinotalea sp. Marseille-Q4924 TaxID=2866571 RepID=UPI001CE451A8|nr:serine/threonine-protein kinase [Actinotalea sp. Marseille-Q4924]